MGRELGLYDSYKSCLHGSSDEKGTLPSSEPPQAETLSDHGFVHFIISSHSATHFSDTHIATDACPMSREEQVLVNSAWRVAITQSACLLSETLIKTS